MKEANFLSSYLVGLFDMNMDYSRNIYYSVDTRRYALARIKRWIPFHCYSSSVAKMSRTISNVESLAMDMRNVCS